MKTMLEKGAVVELPLKEIRTENKKSYYIVTHEGREHAVVMFEFQKDDPVTDKLRCIVKEFRNEIPVFVQDFSVLYRRFYTEGAEYPFTVRRDFTQLAMSYYEVFDTHGFMFRLMFYGDKHLYEGQRIQCRVRSLKGNKLVLELVQEQEKKQTARTGYQLENIVQALDIPKHIKRWLTMVCIRRKEIAEYRTSFKDNEAKFILNFLRELDENMEEWIKPGYRLNNVLLETYLQACLLLLEGSDFLAGYPEQERKNGQKILSRAAQNAEAFMQALHLIEEGRHITYIDTQLAKMRKSGYLFQPDKRLRELMCIFSLEQQLMEQKMQNIFDIILDGDKTHWRNEPFRSAFIEMLDMYIIETRKRIDRMANIEDSEGGQLLVKIIRALAIQLLLATENDDLDRKLNQSMLYRYLTYVDGGNKEALLEKSLRCLTETGVYRLGFGWNEVKDLTLMAIRLSGKETDMSGHTSITQVWQGKKAQLQLADGNLLIQPLERFGGLEPQIPEWMNAWCRTQVMLDGYDIKTVPAGTRNLVEYRKWWKQMEHQLMNGIAATHRTRNRKYRPSVGDTVLVRVNGFDIDDPELNYLRCSVEDGFYEGEGRMHVKNFVRYNLQMDMSAFTNSEGKQYLLNAKVIAMDKKGVMEFSMRDTIWDYVRQCLNTGTIARCVVMEKYKGYYLCISEYGYSVHLKITPDTPALTFGSYIEANIDEINGNGTVEGSFIQQILANFRVQDAFANLIDGFAEEKVYEPEEEKDDIQQEVLMDETYVTEVVHIIDRKALLEQDYVKTYNMLNVARIIALLIGKAELASYYDERMKLLQMFESFALNGTVDHTELMEQSKVNGDLIRMYPLLQTRLTELQVIGSMDMEGQEEFLWQVLQTTANGRLQQITRLVLSYNMLSGFSLFEEKEAIRNKMNEILNIEMKAERPAYFGQEDQHIEFKSSLVYPAGRHMQPNITEQTDEIMKVICGFLNAEGGTLYLGVNDEGVASGLDDEMGFFKNGNLDGLDLHVRNNIVKKLGIQANACVKSVFPDAGKKTVYALEIQPSPYPVSMDGVHYVRQSTSTWPMTGEDLERFLTRREAEVQKMQVNLPAVTATGVMTDIPQQQTGPESGQDAKPKSAKTFSYHDDTHITTGKIRRNAIFAWEDGYREDTLCYFHLLPKNEYMLTDGECWDDTLLSLSIQQAEEDGYIVLVYASGHVVKVPVSELLDKTRWNKYKRYLGEDLFFACPATAEDALLTIVKDERDNVCYRLDDIANLKEGNMSDRGELLSNVPVKAMVQCEVIPKQEVHNLKKIHNLKYTNLGNQLTPQWASHEIKALKRLGVVRDE